MNDPIFVEIGSGLEEMEHEGLELGRAEGLLHLFHQSLDVVVHKLHYNKNAAI